MTLSQPWPAAPALRCYWVQEGLFLAGAYPGALEAAAHRHRIELLWGAGMRTFISLMQEDEKDNGGRRFRPYEDVLAELAARDGQEVTLLRFPVPDLSTPTLEQMVRILDAIDRSLDSGRPVYLHCFGGVGRTGTAVCCWLMRKGRATTGNVIAELQTLRQADRETREKTSPETRRQIEFVEAWPESARGH